MSAATVDGAAAKRPSVKAAGGAAVAGAVLAILGDALVLATSGNAAKDTVSYPLSPQDFRAGQVFFAVTQALMAAGLFALVRSRPRRHRLDRIAAILVMVGSALTVPGELVLAFVADAPVDSARSSAASSVFGVGLLLADIGLIIFGIAALRSRQWQTQWAALPLALGVFQLLVVTPVVLSAGFASVAAFAVITASDVLTTLVGVGLLLDRYRVRVRLTQ